MRKLVLITILVSLFSCKNDKSDCSDIPCSEEFKVITVSIKDKMTNPIALDKFIVKIIDSDIDITRDFNDNEYELMKQYGTYPLFGDEHRENYKNETIRINFIGIQNNQEIVNTNFTVGADCCHVILIDGITDIIVD